MYVMKVLVQILSQIPNSNDGCKREILVVFEHMWLHVSHEYFSRYEPMLRLYIFSEHDNADFL